jgi:hypothetical protein
MAKPAVKVGGELATVWSGRRCLAPLEKDRERGRSFVERQTRCRFLRGSWCTFIGARGGVSGQSRRVIASINASA